MANFGFSLFFYNYRTHTNIFGKINIDFHLNRDIIRVTAPNTERT